MHPTITVYYMAERQNRARLDAEASRGWLVTQAARQNGGRYPLGLAIVAQRVVSWLTHFGAKEPQASTATHTTLVSAR
jgi:hypothetical protein